MLPTIHNIVSTAHIQCLIDDGSASGPTSAPINIQRLHETLPCTEYNRRKFAAITIRLSDPTCTALLFGSGKLVITGNQTWYDSVYTASRLSKALSRVTPGIHFRATSNCVQNIVARGDLALKPNESLDLDALYERENVYCTYTKGVFPGLIYRPRNVPVVFLCFKSGRVVVTGGKSITDVYKGWRKINGYLRGFARQESPPSQHPRSADRRRTSHAKARAGPLGNPSD